MLRPTPTNGLSKLKDIVRALTVTKLESETRPAADATIVELPMLAPVVNVNDVLLPPTGIVTDAGKVVTVALLLVRSIIWPPAPAIVFIATLKLAESKVCKTKEAGVKVIRDEATLTVNAKALDAPSGATTDRLVAPSVAEAATVTFATNEVSLLLTMLAVRPRFGEVIAVTAPRSVPLKITVNKRISVYSR